MKKAWIFLIAVLLGFSASKAQVLDGVYMKEHTLGRKPVAYQHLREADVMWSRTIWRKVILTEKMNHSLYYPTVKMPDRKSLIDLFLYAIDEEGLTAYSTNDPYNEFSVPMTREQINIAFGAEDKIISIPGDDGNPIDVLVRGSIKSEEVRELMIKEVWFFDKQRSVLDVRIVGICPIRIYEKEKGNPDTRTPVATFWIYFPEVRRILANHEVFNPYNDAERRTYDDFFHKRMFSSYIIRESNTYNDRNVAEYSIGLESLLEAERIKEKIFNFQHDLWEF
ncbi:MAG TPA: gliding motility protein GldN [Bacteroidales bacterium]|nr:gliding motility protein GldN [Bacteroidales bacterium]